MYKIALSLVIFFSAKAFAQPDANKVIRAFPVTDYSVALNDSVQLVQVRLPADVKLPEKQLGLVRGIYRDKHSDTVVIGMGRCQLIKGEYYYFAINHKQSATQPREGDLLFTMIDRTPVYQGQVIQLASSFIGLKDVYEKPLYDRYTIFSQWEKKNETAVIDSMVADIHFTGNYFLENNPQMNVKVKGGRYDGSMVLNTMKISTRKDVTDFLDYMIARPRLYAGQEWKIAEVFATWLSEGAPTVVKGE